jgi:hypothetical protein
MIRVLLPLVLLALMPLPARAQHTITISVTAGEEWVHSRAWKGVPLKTRPQMAFWLADLDGNLVQTLYVTRRAGRQSWLGGAFTGEARDEMRRQSALPVWGHARGVQAEDGVFLPTRDEPLPDAETGATPRGGFTRTFELPADLPAGSYHVFAEINQSLHYNETWAEGLPEDDPHWSGGEYGSGQPSLVLRAEVQVGGDLHYEHLEVLGHGHPAGADGLVSADVSTLTTALQIAGAVIATYTPAGS